MIALVSTVAGNPAIHGAARAAPAAFRQGHVFGCRSALARRSRAGLFRRPDDLRACFTIPLMDRQIDSPLYRTLKSELGLSDRDILAHLTPALATLARDVGLGPVMTLLDHHQGRKVYIPSSVDSPSGFTSLFGEEVAAKIIDHLGGGRKFEVSVPFGARVMCRMRAVRALREGASTNEAAARFGISHTRIKALRRTYLITPPPESHRRPNYKPRPKAAPRAKVGAFRAEAFRMLAGGKSATDICAALDVSLPTVRKWQRQYGVMV